MGNLAGKFQFTHPGRGATFIGCRHPYISASFNSRTPGGVRPAPSLLLLSLELVSIHAPREGCDDTQGGVGNSPRDVSIHAPREGCDARLVLLKRLLRSFNSRTPGGVRLDVHQLLAAVVVVSIHAPREGCDVRQLQRVQRAKRFQFTHPGRGATRTWHRSALTSSFQFTHPGRGATASSGRKAGAISRFNSRTPGGVRHHLRQYERRESMFQFTHPGRGATRCGRVDVSADVVSIHAPREGCDTY